MIRAATILATAALAGGAGAQVIRGAGLGPKDIPFHIHVGWGRTETFTSNSATRVQMEGPEVGVDIPLQRPVPGAPIIMFSPSVLLGGQLASGGDTDGYVYRLQLAMNAPVGANGFYTRFGLGYSYATSRGDQFDSVSGFSQRYTLGYGIDTMGAVAKTSVELSYHNASDAALKGWTVGVNVRF